uniref:Serine/threonine-protein kinase PLK n=1 Tax=Saccoglossus kowalevskii TaxID=10224 RepID=A0ABM0GKC1_SACKO|nr:PREDICTED: serine/threonine-protein kinase PLK2-like isoform X1 [Saccoglossus kowalevskii]
MLISKATQAVALRMKDVKGQMERQLEGNNNKQRLKQQASTGSTDTLTEDPDVISDPTSDKQYVRGRLLGKGGFARCYELTESTSKVLYAGKIIPKTRISKPHQRQKLEREIHLHSQLAHHNVVQFLDYFDDDEHVYIILEICNKKSLMHTMRQRKTLTEPEVRFFLLQIIEGIQYLHSQNVIHRDLKLGNILVSDSMEIKLADFGLATRLEFDGDRKRTICGTPNYIAPEVLEKIGHSYEADIWAIGCVMYTMLVGKPPFEGSTLKETYSRVRNNKYNLPFSLHSSAKDLIKQLLNSKPEDRPGLEEILQHEFFTRGFTPTYLPPSVCHTAPRYATTDAGAVDVVDGDYKSREEPRRRFSELSSALQHLRGGRAKVTSKPPTPPSTSKHRRSSTDKTKAVTHAIKNAVSSVIESSKGQSPPKSSNNIPPSKVQEMLMTCTRHMPEEPYNSTPKYKPKGSEVLWVTKWVDYSNKYGFGYQLSDTSVGVMFNDNSRICFLPNRSTVQYIGVDRKVQIFAMTSVPQRLANKVTLLDYFATYMDEHLIKGGDLESKEKSSPTKRKVLQSEPGTAVQPFMQNWTKTKDSITMYLSNGALQINFFEDHTKIVLSYNNSDHLVTYVDNERICHTYRLLHVAHYGCPAHLHARMLYSVNAVKNIVAQEAATTST